MTDNTVTQPWYAQIYSGSWKRSRGGDAPVTEPATGEILARTGIASSEDVEAGGRAPPAAAPPTGA
ncbi:MAG: hypothetical protein JJU06_03870, partial [Ectothiorhodospiraceae bacterium]|nr:hypothetical protein [Ectothiorhodospiraceae bacterium]